MGEDFNSIKTMNETYGGNVTFFRKGRYIEQLHKFTSVFRRDQILVLSSQGMFDHTSSLMESIRKFIHVKKDESFNRPLPHGTWTALFRQLQDLSPLIDWCTISTVDLFFSRWPLREDVQNGCCRLHYISCSSAGLLCARHNERLLWTV